MAVTNKSRNRTLDAMQRVWARKVLKQEASEQGRSDSPQCREARTYLKDY